MEDLVMLERCSCGHVPTEHLIAADSTGPGIYHCEASISLGRICGCAEYSPRLADDRRAADDPEIDEELPWRAA
jgi:hypothetical protein